MNNKVVITGILKDVEFSHEFNGEIFYRGMIESKRLSGTIDAVPVLIPGKLLDDQEGKNVKIKGEFRSYNKDKHVILNVLTKEIEYNEDRSEINAIYLDGFLCKKPIYRKTPKGFEITDLIIAVNRKNGKSDYFPCIAWGINARKVKKSEAGDKVEIQGRIQSRMYSKKNEDGTEEQKTAYEVSIGEIRL